MANDNTNVTTGKPHTGGAIYRAPIGTTAPTDATTALNAAFKHVGYISEDGVTNGNSINSETVKAWGGDSVYTVTTSRDNTYSFTMIEALNTEAMKVYYGDDNVLGSRAAGITIKSNNKDMGTHIYVIEQILAGKIPMRIVIPLGQVTEVEDITYKDDELIAYGVTITGNQDASGNTGYQYIAGESNSTPAVT